MTFGRIAGIMLFWLASSFGASAQTQVQVSSASELMRALQAAKGGERIMLAPGDYGPLSINTKRERWAEYGSRVLLASADPARPATFSSVSLIGGQNLSFSNVTFKYTFAVGDKVNLRPFTFRGVKNLTISDSRILGSLASGTGTQADGYGTGIGLAIEDSSAVTIERNVFRYWHRGALFHEASDLTVRGNDVSEIRSDGMDFAQVERVLIERNHIHNFKALIGSGDHCDLIQFWTNQTKAPSVDITIRDNVLDRGQGSWTQSIFMRNEEVDNKRAGREMFYRNITITGNVIRNSHLHGITVGETAGLTIANNTLIQAEASPRPLHVTVPGINVSLASENVRIENNIAPRFPDLGAKPRDGWTVANNMRVQRNFTRAKDFYANIFVDALAEGDVPLQKLQRLPSDAAGEANVGSLMTSFDAKPANPVVVIRTSPASGEQGPSQRLDASTIYGPGGKIDSAGANAVWDLGNGASKSGLIVSHRFPSPGTYKVSVAVMLANGMRVSGTRTLLVE